MTKFLTLRCYADSDFIRQLNALAEDGWHMVDSGYTQDVNKLPHQNVWWAVLRKDTD